jgi:hypothetical protein
MKERYQWRKEMKRDNFTTKAIGEMLKEKLTKEELNILCNAFDQGLLNSVFYNYLLKEDKKNFPEDYKE